MSQPPLSRAIQQLERRLGVTFLHRDRRGVALSEAGAVLLVEAWAVLDAAAVAALVEAAAAAGSWRSASLLFRLRWQGAQGRW